MKISKCLMVGEKTVEIVSETVTTESGDFGAGIFNVNSATPLSGEAVFSVGIGNILSPWFTGDIIRCVRDTARTHRLFIREKTIRLEKHFPLSLRNTTPGDILSKLSTAAKLTFTTDGGNWLKKPMPHFLAHGSGLDTVALIGAEAAIPDFITATNPDGSLYLGSYAKSNAAREISLLPETLFTDLSAVGATLPIIPGLRPGYRLQIGDGGTVAKITAITVSGAFMRIKFEV